MAHAAPPSRRAAPATAPKTTNADKPLSSAGCVPSSLVPMLPVAAPEAVGEGEGLAVAVGEAVEVGESVEVGEAVTDDETVGAGEDTCVTEAVAVGVVVCEAGGVGVGHAAAAAPNRAISRPHADTTRLPPLWSCG